MDILIYNIGAFILCGPKFRCERKLVAQVALRKHEENILG